MGESNRVRWLSILESTWGTLPTTPTMLEILRTGGSLTGNRGHVVSQAVRSNRMRRGLFKTNKDSSGSLECELTSGQFDTFVQAAQCSTWSAAITAAVSVTFDTTADTIVRAAGSFVSDGWLAGMHIYVSGAADTPNNGYARVTAVSATELTVDKNLTTNAVAASCVLRNDGMIRGGTTATSLSLEQGHLDLSHFYLFTGVRVGAMTLRFSPDALVTATFELMGHYPTYGTSTNASAVTDANAFDAFNATSDVGAFFEGGAACTEDLTALEVTLSNNLRLRRKIQSEAPSGIAYGTRDVTGNLSWYAGASHTLVDKALNFTESNIYVRATNAANKTMIVTIPALKYTGSPSPNANGLDGDVSNEHPFTAYQSGTGATAYDLQFDRITPA